MLLIGYSAVYYNYLPSSTIKMQHFGFIGIVYALSVLMPRYAPKSLTIAESFTLSTLIVIYSGFSLKQLMQPVVSSVGSPDLNSAVFLPWLFLLIGVVLWWVLGRAVNSSVSFLLATLLVLALIALLIS